MVDVHQQSAALRNRSKAAAAIVEDVWPAISSGSEAVLRDPWVLTENDLQWLIALGKKRYGEQYDYVTVEGWYRNNVLKNPMMFHPTRLTNSFLIGLITSVPWTPGENEYHVVFICADEGAMWEAAKLLRNSITWAKRRGCKYWRLSSDTKFDIEPIARRIGATEVSPRFCVNLSEWQP